MAPSVNPLVIEARNVLQRGVGDVIEASVECAEAESQTVLSDILDKSWDLKEVMRMYEGTLSASFDMEEQYDRVILKLQDEIELLEEKKKKIASRYQG
jgi:hypothetical protein